MGIVDTAKKCLGRVRYVFGAGQINPDGSGKSDCSYFTMWVYQQEGINIGRNTEAQLGKGTEVSRQALQPGDLVFFKDTYASNYKDGVSHVGISLGGTKFIHCSSGAGTVTVSDLTSAYYQSHYLRAKRIVDSDNDTADDGIADEGIGDGAADGEASSQPADDLTFVGDILLLIITLLVGGAGILFFLRAFDIKLPGIKGVIP